MGVLTTRVFLEVQRVIKVVILASGLADFLGDRAQAESFSKPAHTPSNEETTDHS